MHDGRLHGYVSDGYALHDAHVADVRQSVFDVRRDVHELCSHVRADGRQRRDDDALRRNVQEMRRILQDDEQGNDGRLSFQSTGVGKFKPGQVPAYPG
ncbi:hypothetical protein [Acidobacterium sp. S8]|uniref:hypothetical protein n=1 Tax=Acidobacterium sp. S8 TaxID=1641854 RepID=UPI00131AF4FB|nr:hypothetical protein [Acidobacterium sp. S8]